MPAILICQKEDGTITVNAMPEPPQGYEEGAVEAASLDEAMEIARGVLDTGSTMKGEGTGDGHPATQDRQDTDRPQEGDIDATGQSSPDAGGSPAHQGDESEEAMQQGFDRARKGY